ncbi:MAG: hypothetical protein ACO3OV_01875 [Steroidobacteraceae bacterium]
MARPRTERTTHARKGAKRSRKVSTKARSKNAAATAGTAAPSPARLPRIAKGKKPQYFTDPATDKLLWMTLTLMEELSVTRDRLDTVERLLAKRRVLTLKDIETWKPDDRAATERATRRAAYVDRMMRAIHRELEELTRGDMPATEAEVIAAVES